MYLTASKFQKSLLDSNVRDIIRLAVCMKYFEEQYQEAHDATVYRRVLLRQVATLAEKGEIAIVTRGMDCDCSAWEDQVRYLPAHMPTIDRWLREFWEQAEGPQGYYIESPSIARGLREKHRDLAAEAFEDGHPHHIVYGG